MNHQFLGDDGSQCRISQMPGIPACVCTAYAYCVCNRLASDFHSESLHHGLGGWGRNWLKQVVSKSSFLKFHGQNSEIYTHSYYSLSFIGINPLRNTVMPFKCAIRLCLLGSSPLLVSSPIHKRNRQIFQGLLEIMGEEGMQIESEG